MLRCHTEATGSFQEDTIVNTGSIADTVHINDVTDLLVVNGQAGNLPSVTGARHPVVLGSFTPGGPR